jgi:alkanesulfonate monooxygenase SsuD/methylene tetrahydromethanopterin reductase-like flavin-dependent oxidoreductase (luciferase family)
MQISMTLPTMLPHGRDDVLAWCSAVDEGPFASLAVPERITYPSHSWIVQLSAAAALTERVRLWTTIVILPAHDAVETAKHLASVDVLSDGRLTVGIGVGGREHDYLAIGGDMSRRWARMDEQVSTMRAIWAGQPPFDGADPVGPAPLQEGGPPIIAGVLGPKALARAAHWAAGVDDSTSVFGVDAATVGPAYERIRAAWHDAGRENQPHISASLWYALGDGAAERLSGYCYDYMRVFGDDLARHLATSVTCNDAGTLQEAVKVLDDLGCDELFLVPTTTDVTELERTREALGI